MTDKNTRKPIIYNGQSAYEYENGLILNADTKKVMKPAKNTLITTQKARELMAVRALKYADAITDGLSAVDLPKTIPPMNPQGSKSQLARYAYACMVREVASMVFDPEAERKDKINALKLINQMIDKYSVPNDPANSENPNKSPVNIDKAIILLSSLDNIIESRSD